MESHFPFHKLSALQNMMSNIVVEGHEKVWEFIDTIPEAIKRCNQRKLFWEALKKLEKWK